MKLVIVLVTLLLFNICNQKKSFDFDNYCENVNDLEVKLSKENHFDSIRNTCSILDTVVINDFNSFLIIKSKLNTEFKAVESKSIRGYLRNNFFDITMVFFDSKNSAKKGYETILEETINPSDGDYPFFIYKKIFITKNIVFMFSDISNKFTNVSESFKKIIEN